MASHSKTPLLLGLLGLLLAGTFALSKLDGGTGEGQFAELGLESETGGASAGDLEPAQRPKVVLEDPTLRPPVVANPDREIAPLEVELSLVQAGAAALEGDLAPPGSGANARLRGTLLAGDEVLMGTVTFLHGSNEGRVLSTDSSGCFRAADLYPGVTIVSIATDRGWTSEREILLRSLSTTQLNVGFASGALAVVQGKVLDPEGEPFPDALVRMDGTVGRTDQDGIFRFPRISPGKVMAVVEAPGFARYQEFVSVARATVVPPDQIIFRLQPEAILEVRVVESLGHPGPAQLFLMPAGGRRTRGQGDYPWHLINPILIHPGASKRIEGLAPGTMTAMLFKAGAIAKPRRTSVRLYPGRVSSKELHLEPTDGLRGTVMLEGKPAPGVRVRLEAPNAASATTRLLGLRPTFGEELVIPNLPAGSQELITDKRGRFHFTIWEEFDDRYYLTAESSDGTMRGRRVVGAEDSGLEVALKPVPNDPGRLELVVPGRFPTLPVRVMVDGQAREPHKLLAGETLVIEDLPPGLWKFDATWSGQTVSRGERLEVGSGAKVSLEVSLPRAASGGR